MSINLCVGTAGTSVWFSKDLGETWTRPYSESGLYLECRVWALSGHSERPDTLYAGTDEGLYRWSFKEERWTHLPSPMDGLCIWAVAQSPRNPDVLVAGTQPAALFRSDDGGAAWRKLDAVMAEQCIFVQRPRVTQILFDPLEPRTIWAGVEIDAVWRSDDDGQTWTRLENGLVSGDIHDLAVIPDGQETSVFIATNKGLHRSTDRGASFDLELLDSPWQYTRTIVPRADNDGTVFLTNGNGPPGSTGRLLRSRDHGRHWKDANLPGELNSTPWCIATHPADPKLLFVATNLGQLFRSEDGGESWVKLRRELGEIRAMVWMPG